MITRKPIGDLQLESGSLNEAALSILIGLTGIRTQAIIDSLREYYVVGLSKKEAYQKHNVDKTTFSRRLTAIQAAFTEIQLFNAAYRTKK